MVIGLYSVLWFLGMSWLHSCKLHCDDLSYTHHAQLCFTRSICPLERFDAVWISAMLCTAIAQFASLKAKRLQYGSPSLAPF